MKDTSQHYRSAVKAAKRIVVKVGTGVLTDQEGQPNQHRIEHIVKQLATLQQAGKEIVLVSSGAIATGLQTLGLSCRPSALPELQMAASIGQTRLLSIYSRYFKQHGCCISQALLTHPDLKSRRRHLNARNTLLKLLEYKVIPIINENDVVSVDELRIGDNDMLSSLVTLLIDADLLLILTSPEGLMMPDPDQGTRRVHYLPRVTSQTFRWVTDEIQALSVGGMRSKLKVAQAVTKEGVLVIIASGKKNDTITHALQGEDVGTLIGDQVPASLLAKRKRWIAYFHQPQGRLLIDAGACAALKDRGGSLLPIGVKKVEGRFAAGEMVEIVDLNEGTIGCGLVEYNSQDLNKIKGSPSTAIASILGIQLHDVVIHRNNLVLN